MVKDYPTYEVPKLNSLQDLLLRSAKLYPDKLALEDLSENPISSVTFKQLHDYVVRFGKALQEIGLNERDHIAVISENRVQWALTYFTSMCFNMVIVPIDKNLNQNEILNIIHESEAKAIVFSDPFEPLMKEKRDSLINMEYYINMDSKEDADGIFSMTKIIQKQSTSIEKFPFVNPEEMAEIIFTSGSLGRAKGVMLTQKNIASNLMAMTSMIKIGSEDRFLSVLPLHHKYECTCGLLCPLYAGGSAHYARSLKTVVDDLQKVKATILLGVPLLYDKMFKKIYKGIKEDRVKSKIVPPLISLTNVFESIVRRRYPPVDVALKWLSEQEIKSIRPAMMTGTGSCVFAAYPDEDSARRIKVLAEKLTEQQATKDWQVFCAKAYNESPLSKKMHHGNQ